MNRAGSIKIWFILIFMVVLSFAVKLYYLQNFPLSGDEVGVGVTQSVGQTLRYFFTDRSSILPLNTYLEMMEYNKDYGCANTLMCLSFAGMHPPLYYLMLRGYIYLFGNDAETLRLFSVIISSFSILVAYVLGKEICCRKAGLILAFIIAFSAYSVKYSVMVRPYPLMTLLSLLSTWIMLKAVSGDFLNFRKSMVYILITVIGMYTLYHYAFVVMFQLVYLILTAWFHEDKNGRSNRILKIFFIYLAVIILFSPWIPALLVQLNAVNKGEYYFTEHTFSPFSTLFSIFWVNSSHKLPGLVPGIVRDIITLIYAAIIVFGMVNLSADRRKRLYVLAFVGHILIYILAEYFKGMNTLLVRKFLFFIVPGLSLFLAVAVLAISHKGLKYLVAFFVCSTLGVNLAGELNSSRFFDGPNMVKPAMVIKETAQAGPTLIISNSGVLRYFFALTHSIKDIETELDIVTVSPKMIKDFGWHNFSKYSNLVILNDSTETDVLYTRQQIEEFVSEANMKVISSEQYNKDSRYYILSSSVAN